MSKIAFLGLGLMGTPMARRLIEAGNEVTVWNRTPARTEPFAQLGSAVADTPAKAVSNAEFVITMVANPQALQAVLFQNQGLASAISAGQVWIDMSTVGPDEFRAAAARMPEGVIMVDAPVRGSVPEATEGRLHIFVGSDDRLFPRLQSLLGALGEVRLVGPPGAGQAMKLVVNLALVTAMTTFGEALTLGKALRLDSASVIDVLSESPIAGIVHAKRGNVEASQYPANFKLELASKDITLVDRAAKAFGLELPEATAARRWMEEAMSEGLGDLDFSAVAETIQDHAGLREENKP